MVNVYKGTGDALQCSSHRSIRLLEHVLKVLERVIEARVRRIVKIDDMQFDLMPGRGTTDAIFIVRQCMLLQLDTPVVCTSHIQESISFTPINIHHSAQ